MLRLFNKKYTESHEQTLAWMNGTPVIVDVGMKDLLEQLWRLGLKTDYSCQNNLGNSYILFTDTQEALRFLMFIEEFDPTYDNHLKVRIKKYNGGATVRFNPDMVYKITSELRKLESL